MTDRDTAPHATAAEPGQRAGLTSVIIVAADSGGSLADAVGAALASSAPVELIVVDNASRDGCADLVRERYRSDARVRVIGNANNLGFGAGCNRGVAQASGDALLFLNPDCVLGPDAVARLRAAAKTGFALLGVAIVDAAGVAEPASRRRDPTLRRSLMTLSGLARLEARWPFFTGVALPGAIAGPQVEPVDAVSGALMFVQREVFQRIGGFDEGYFLHAEDLDLCRRVRDAGFRVGCVNTLQVVHGKGGSSRHRPLFVAWHKHRGLWRWFVKFDPAAHNRLTRGIVWSGLWLHFGLQAPFLAWRQRFASARIVQRPPSDSG